MFASGACHGSQLSVFHFQNGGLYCQHSLVGFHKVASFPGLTLVIRVFKIQSPSTFLNTGGCDESPVVHNGLVLHRSQIVGLQHGAWCPGFSPVDRAGHPSVPVCHVVAYFEVNLQFSVAWLLIDHGVPTSLSLIAFRILCYPLVKDGSHLGCCVSAVYARQSCQGSICRSCFEHSVCHQLRFLPFLAALGLLAYPDTHIRIALLGTSKVGGYQIALSGFRDGGRVTFGEGCLCVEKLVCYNGWMLHGQRLLQIINARAQFSCLAVGQGQCGMCVGRYFHMPCQRAVLLLPSAHNVAVDAFVATVDVVYLIHAEIGFQ